MHVLAAIMCIYSVIDHKVRLTMHIHVPNASHSSGVLQSNSVLSKVSRGRKEGKVGEGDFPPLLMRDLEVESATGINREDDTPLCSNKSVMLCFAKSLLRLYKQINLVNC